jgi:hypothetical protein
MASSTSYVVCDFAFNALCFLEFDAIHMRMRHAGSAEAIRETVHAGKQQGSDTGGRGVACVVLFVERRVQVYPRSRHPRSEI